MRVECRHLNDASTCRACQFEAEMSLQPWPDRAVDTGPMECPITLRRGLTGAKPEKVCHWAFEVVGARPDDVLDDLFPGTGAVSRAWSTWQRLFSLPQESTDGR